MSNKIKDLFKPRCIHRHLENEHPHCFKDGKPIENREPEPVKILSLDIETLPILGYSWGVWNQNIYANQVVKDWSLLSYSAKWLGNDNMISDVLTPREASVRNDSRLARNIWKLLEDADIVVTHNGRRFDIKKINARFWKHGLNPTSSYKVIDTLVSAKQVFGLTYNSMAFIAEFIEADNKLDTEFGLWTACDNGDRDALQRMREYNEQDVLTQEQIYMEMRPWITGHPDLRVYSKLENSCPICLGSNFKEIGLYTANKLQYKEYRCSCGAVFHDSKSIRDTVEILSKEI